LCPPTLPFLLFSESTKDSFPGKGPITMTDFDDEAPKGTQTAIHTSPTIEREDNYSSQQSEIENDKGIKSRINQTPVSTILLYPFSTNTFTDQGLSFGFFCKVVSTIADYFSTPEARATPLTPSVDAPRFNFYFVHSALPFHGMHHDFSPNGWVIHAFCTTFFFPLLLGLRCVFESDERYPHFPGRFFTPCPFGLHTSRLNMWVFLL